MIQPSHVMLIDVGTKPLTGSLFYLYEALVCDPQLAGCCGEIKPMDYDLWKSVVPAQVVEYKFSHMLDKALESVIGYITVLPGAFSAYRWEALQGSPLWDDYFKSICHPELMNAFQSNIYLAEDRVLSLSLVGKKGNNYILRYVKSIVAETDVPESLAELISHRRRWINGSWFALIDVLKRFRIVYGSNHSWIRKFFITLEMVYFLIYVVYSWFMVGIYCLAIIITLRNDVANGKSKSSWIENILITFYVSVIITIFITSMGVKPKKVENIFRFFCAILGVFQFYIILLIAELYYTTAQNFQLNILIILGIASIFLFIVLLNGEVWTIFKGIFHYIFFIPTYMNIFIIYSICNIHDCTWGNRPDKLNSEEKEKLEDFEEFRTKWAVVWALCNSGFAYGMKGVNMSNPDLCFYFLYSILAVSISILILRAVGGVLYIVVEKCKKTMKKTNVVRPTFVV